MTHAFEARTAYDVPIHSVFLGSEDEALLWAAHNVETFPGLRIAKRLRTGWKVIFTHEIPKET